MAHFAKVLDGIVVDVIVAEPEFFETFVDSSAGEWIQTSYNTDAGVHYDPETGEPSADQSQALRYNYAGKAFTYDWEADAFIPPKVWDSWVLDTNTYTWTAPVPYPNDGSRYSWDEENLQWVFEYEQSPAE